MGHDRSTLEAAEEHHPTVRPEQTLIQDRAIAGPVTVTPFGVNGRFPPDQRGTPTRVALLIDGQVHSTALVIGQHFVLPLPPHALGMLLDVVDVPGAFSVLAAPVDFAAARGLRWQQWHIVRGRAEGAFTLSGHAAPVDAAIPVEIFAGPEFYGRGFALPAADGEPGIWRFTAPLCRLLHMQQSVTVCPRVGGMLLAQPITITARQCGYAGYADPTNMPLARGWIVDADDPLRLVKLDLRINGRTVASGESGLARPDIAALGLGTEHAGFNLAIPDGVSSGRDSVVEVVVAGTELRLINCPYIRRGALLLEGVFDGWEGPCATGWVVNMLDPEAKLTVQAVCDGEVVGTAVADRLREDVRAAGLPTAQCGFLIWLERKLPALFGREIAVRVAGAEHDLAGSPRVLRQNPNITRFLARVALPAPLRQRLSRRITHRTGAMLVSIVMPVFNPPEAWLREALDSVLAQWSVHWELICVNDGSTKPHVRRVLDAYAAHDGRIKVLHSLVNGGIARATNFGLRAAAGGYVTFMDHDDAIEPDAVYRLAQAALQTGAELIYSDEVLTTEDTSAMLDVRARPAFSYDYYLSHPYFVHLVCVRTDLARRLAGWDERLAISADVDFILRVIEHANRVAHVPAVLYRWRTHGGSAGHAKQAQVTEATMAALTRHLARQGHPASVREGLGFNQYHIDWPDDGGEVLVVIPTKNRADLLKTAIESVVATAPRETIRIVVIDHQSTDRATIRYLKTLRLRHTVMPYAGKFNYARMNNLAVRTHCGGARYILFLNNDVEAREPGWIGRLRSLCARPGVAAAGPMLLYGDGRVQHAGVLMGFAGAAEHVQKFGEAYVGGGRNPGYSCILTSVRDYSAVTAACMMVRRDVFDTVDGFDEKFAVGFNDTDLCLRFRRAGFKVLYDGHTVLYHHESATRTADRALDHPEDDARLQRQWPEYFTQGDPFYSRMLTGSGRDHMLREDGGCKGQQAARVVTLCPATETPKPKRAKTKARVSKTGAASNDRSDDD